jgi:hypothetical protein
MRMPSHPFVSGAVGREKVSIAFFPTQDLTAAAEKCVTNSLSYRVSLLTLER